MAPPAGWLREPVHSANVVQELSTKGSCARLAGYWAKLNPQKWTQNQPPGFFMGSKSAQILTLMPNLLSDYLGYKLNLRILDSDFLLEDP